MIKVDFDPQQLTGNLRTEWDAWEKKAQDATNAVIQAWEDWRANGSPGEFKYKFNKKVWGELKDWLLKNVFHNKCAYCETQVVRADYDAEHFRPKGRVTVKVGAKKTQRKCKARDELGNENNHPGYFWLAYTWTNLLPSCHYCNARNGKGTQFPINKSHVSVTFVPTPAKLKCSRIMSKARANVYYLQPEDLNDMEDPLVLHPYVDDPSQHLVFGEFGVVTPRDGSEKGRHSIDVYNLDSGPLNDARRDAQYDVFKDYSAEFARGRAISVQDRINAAKALIAGYISGEEPYSAAVMAYLRLNYSNHNLPDTP